MCQSAKVYMWLNISKLIDWSTKLTHYFQRIYFLHYWSASSTSYWQIQVEVSPIFKISNLLFFDVIYLYRFKGNTWKFNIIFHNILRDISLSKKILRNTASKPFQVPKILPLNSINENLTEWKEKMTKLIVIMGDYDSSHNNW